ncbi:MAG: hypothetical protein ACKVT0_12080 [Planctomycetaceae bacterium]
MSHLLPKFRWLLTLGFTLIIAEGSIPADSVLAQQAETNVKPRDIRTVVANGKHNAFTALVKWKDAFWLSFREATDHGSGDGDLILLKSSDAETWMEAKRLNIVPDDRDPQLLIADDRLIWFDPGLEGKQLTTFATWTDDGETWSEPIPVYEPQFILWKPLAVESGYYATAHYKADVSGGVGRKVHLIKSADGLKWEKVSTIRERKWESETTLYFPEPDRAVAFLRQKYGSPPGSILESQAPFTEWTERDAGVHLSGHSVHTIDGVTYLLSRLRKPDDSGTMIYVYVDDKLEPYCEIPSGGDCSYPEVARIGEEMLISYYSSHEGTTNVYTCRVPLKGK